jgi:hypothetical protein
MSLIGTVSNSSVAAVVVAFIAAAVIVVLVAACLSLRRSARQLQVLADELAGHAGAVIGEAEATIARAQGELDRVDDLIGSAEAITETVGSATRLAHTAFATPVIKIMALGAGTARAGRRIRRAS